MVQLNMHSIFTEWKYGSNDKRSMKENMDKVSNFITEWSLAYYN